jgi:L-fucose isomerase-like protein
VKRGTVQLKPVYVGISHYREIYGSVCSADVDGTPPIKPPTADETEKNARRWVSGFQERSPVGFVRLEKPLIIKEHADLRRLAADLTHATDALVVKFLGNTPLIERALKHYGLPVFNDVPDETVLRGLRVKKLLKESKCIYVGEIPSFSAPLGPWDFGVLMERFGVLIRHIETNEFFRWFDHVTEKDVRHALEGWRHDFEQVIEPTDDDLVQAARVYLALKGLAEREDANGIAVNCGRLTEERPVVPCLAFARLIDEGIMCACEGDITAMLSSLVLHGASEKTVLMGNFGARPGQFEARQGEVSIEHDVIPRSMATSGFTVRDYHGRAFGVTGYAPIRRNEPMTLLNMDPGLRKISVLEGTVRESEDGGHCRVIIHMTVDGDPARVPEVIVGSQHVSMAFGRWQDALEKAGQLLGMEVRHL